MFTCHLNRLRRGMLGLLGLGVVAAPAVHAQDFPTQPVRVIVSFAAGGATDVGTRGLIATSSEFTTQPMLVENVVGAAGVTGSLQVMKAKPDGHTLLSADSVMITLPLFQPNVPIRLEQFRPIGVFQVRGAWLLVRPNRGWRTLDDFVKAAREQPGKLTVGVPAKGSPQELAVAAVEDAYGIRLNVIPYQGGAQTMAAFLGDQLDAVMTGSPAGLDSIKAGQAQFLVASTKLEIEGFPGKLTSFADVGIPHDVSIWTAVWAPANTPDKVVADAAKLFGAMANHPKYVQFARNYGTTPVWMGPDEAQKFITASAAAHKKLYDLIRK